MKRDIAIHLISTLILLVLMVLTKGWFDLSYWPLLLGGVAGMIMPDIDHIIYVYFLKPQELSSQRVDFMVSKGRIMRSIEILYETRAERNGLIFHSSHFQLIFWVLTYLVVTSSGSLFGRGLVGAFSLHLLIDAAVDWRTMGNLSNWFSQIRLNLNSDQEKIYLLCNLLALFLFVILI